MNNSDRNRFIELSIKDFTIFICMITVSINRVLCSYFIIQSMQSLPKSIEIITILPEDEVEYIDLCLILFA